MPENGSTARSTGRWTPLGASGWPALWAAYLLVIFLPGLFLSWAYGALVQEKPSTLLPYAHWDTYDYVLEARGFMAAEFDMGRFTLNEAEAGLKSSPFGPHSFVYPILMSAVARLAGDSFLNAAPLLNMVVMGLCLGVACVLTRPGWLQLGFLALAVVSIPDFLHVGATFWQESANYSLGILLSSFFYRMLLARTARARRAWGGIVFAALMAASLIRPVWGLLFIAFFGLALPASLPSRALAFLLGSVCFVGNYLLYQFTASPFVSYNSAGRQAAEAALSGRASLAEVLRHMAVVMADNCNGAIAQAQKQPFLFVVFAFSLAGILAICLKRKAIRERFASERMALDIAIVFGSILLGYFAAALLFQGLDPRHLFPSFLFSLLFLAHARVARLLVVFVLGAQLASTAMQVQPVQNLAYELARSIQSRESRIDRFSSLAGWLMPYSRQANSWCNTVLVGNHDTVTEYLGLPAGIGLSYVLTYTSYAPPAKSRYLLLKNDWQIDYFKGSNRLAFLSHTTGGDLYLNQDCPCAGDAPTVLDPEHAGRALEELERTEAVRNMRSWPYVRETQWRGLGLMAGGIMMEATLDLDVSALTEAQTGAGLLTKAAAGRIREGLDKMQLVLTFVRSQDGFTGPRNPRLFVHCRSGMLNTYDLPDGALDDMAGGRPPKPVSLKYNEMDLFICDYW